ncbi:tRNA (adenosine(37)-N6)-threonylcarbamoyltransferase complex ATPase subunit type 1 TsaE [Sphingomonas sediminicola]|jgi:tRNA threonylcarbamoyladenosine biosynthesis protein TsaE|uniref:tRNA threonylcarbamoyladenosine biosynthesis protein TsaE n=1 Tax=Sphingomonas sediminicola TaxID=386874 RepID=A0ABX6TA81_9SPHN|nr:tRNA (adenosine(37)-N6)-threonylcarbamoyltransferase complex ATPase subunit type 1 TsaE [Sphingomonas sediminicola]QNP46757.1 tRNA (adenosine(37)-N6)-threonylcarbamoyltransferase complex ATPase subunit type 1 TsaE [Sphingomonas sediminicola]
MNLADEQATEALGRLLARAARAGDVITMSGPLGVGKTALARGFLGALGHEGEAPSPSFAIVQPYEDLEPPVWHVDLFRINDVGELEELGLEAAADGVLLIEWPEKAGDQAWPQALGLTLEFAEGNARRLTAKVPPSWQSRWPPQ